MGRTSSNKIKEYQKKNLSDLMEYAHYVIENSRSVNAEAQKLRDNLKINRLNTTILSDSGLPEPKQSLQYLKNSSS